MRCVVSCGSTSFPWLVFFFGALLWGSMIHKHTGRWMWQMSTSVVSWNWEKYSCHSKLVSTLSTLLLSVLSWKSISGVEPSSVIIERKYLKLVTVSSFCPFILISVLMPLVLFVISLVFSALTSMPLAVSVQSFMFQGETWCTDLGSRPSDQFRCNTIWDITPEPSRTAVPPYLGPCRPACNSLELCQTQSRRFTTEIGLMCCNDQWLVN